MLLLDPNHNARREAEVALPLPAKVRRIVIDLERPHCEVLAHDDVHASTKRHRDSPKILWDDPFDLFFGYAYNRAPDEAVKNLNGWGFGFGVPLKLWFMSKWELSARSEFGVVRGSRQIGTSTAPKVVSMIRALSSIGGWSFYI